MRMCTCKLRLLFLMLCLLHMCVPIVCVSSMQVGCCQVWTQLNAYVVEKTGSELARSTCEQRQEVCADITLIKKFIAESNAVLPDGIKLADNGRDYILNVTDARDPEVFLNLFVWAFLGRTVSNPAINHEGLQHRYLEYDIQNDELSVRTPSCEFNKAVYTAMVLVSVSLLMFLIGMQIVDRHHASKAKTDAVDNSDAGNAVALPVHGHSTSVTKPTGAMLRPGQNAFQSPLQRGSMPPLAFRL
jgi:hypothetical protein